MRIEIESFLVGINWVHVRGRAIARDADIRLTVHFRCPESKSLPELRELARDEVLRYLDPA